MLTRMMVGGLAAMLALVLATGAVEAKPKKGQTFGDWKVDCQPGDNKQERCITFQSQATKDGQRMLDVSIGFLGPKGEPVAVAILPLGISLMDGAAIGVDENPLIPLMIVTCRPDGCESSAVLDQNKLNLVKAAKKMAVGIIPFGTNKPVWIPVSVNGIGQAIDGLK